MFRVRGEPTLRQYGLHVVKTRSPVSSEQHSRYLDLAVCFVNRVSIKDWNAVEHLNKWSDLVIRNICLRLKQLQHVDHNLPVLLLWYGGRSPIYKFSHLINSSQYLFNLRFLHLMELVYNVSTNIFQSTLFKIVIKELVEGVVVLQQSSFSFCSPFFAFSYSGRVILIEKISELPIGHAAKLFSL